MKELLILTPEGKWIHKDSVNGDTDITKGLTSHISQVEQKAINKTLDKVEKELDGWNVPHYMAQLIVQGMKKKLKKLRQ